MENKRISNKIVGLLLLLALVWLMPLTTIAQNHWASQSAAYEDNMTLTGIILINGVEQQTTALEVGAFCGEECRGAMRPVLFPPTQQYVVQMTIYGEVGDLITFRLYDHDMGEELYTVPPDPITFSTTSLGALMDPYELNFLHIVTIAASASPSEGGTVSGMGEYASGSNCTLTATPSQGYYFFYWSENGEIVSTDAEYSFVVTNNRELVCVFGLPLTVSVVASPIEGGTVEGSGEFSYGSTCTLSATPNDGFVFVSWNLNGEVLSSLASYSFTVTESVELVAVFMKHFQIGSGTAGNGALPSQAFYNYTLSQQIYTADEIGGSKTINNICFFNKATYTISRIYDVYLVHTTKTAFDNNTDWIAVTESDRVFSGRVTMTHGVWSAIVFDRPFEYDGTSNLVLVVDDNTGGWSSSMLCLAFDANGNQTLHVNSRDTNYDPFNPGLYEGTLYSSKNQIVFGIDVNYRIVSVSASPSEAGTVSGGGTFLPGETCSVIATANEGYHFDNWSENGEVVSTESSYSFIVDDDRVLVANYTFNPHTILASANPSEFGSVSGAGTYLEGTECTLTATANTGYTFVNWTENGEMVSTEASYSFIVMGDRELVANFALQSYIISASANPNEGGMVSGANTYNYGTTCTLTATANTGYTFDNWTENGTIVSYAAVYSFEVTGARALVANFVDASGTGVLSGVFTVGEHAHVQFSKGNLQYQASTGTWRFATYQYDYIGNDNSNISQTYSGWIDLFGWGTSGYSHGANCYQPWSTSTSYSDYYAYGVYSNNLYSGNGQADWGYNAISNGGNLENSGWRTLTRPEWDFVFNTRSTISGIRYAKATVNGVNGVVLLPDDWTASTYALNSTNSISADYTTNTIAAEDWANVLEANGAVFLPAAGYRNGTSVYSFGQYGDYWSSSRCAMFNTYYVHFLSDNLYISSNSPRSSGHSVRLVRIAENYSYEINVTPNPLEGGVVSGGGTYEEGVECTLTATPTEDYIFSNWTENGNVVSTEATYSFIVSGDRTLVANFSLLQFDITVSALPEEGGSVTGGGTYQYGQSCTLTAMADEGYTFVNWTESGEVVSIEATYSFTVIGDRNLVGNFAVSSAGNYVDLDLPSGTLWAACNIGANAPEQYGDYFAWGETQPKDNYSWNTYQYCNGSESSLIRYCNSSGFGYNGFTDNLTMLLPEDDAATVNWGEDWRMPTKEEWQELFNNTTMTWTQQNGVKGRLFTAANGASLFLPAAGYRWDNELDGIGSYGYYWSRSLRTDYPDYAWYLDFGSGGYHMYGHNRYLGLSVRPVRVSFALVTATPSPAEGGEVSGGGTYAVGTTCTLTAMPAEGYVFVNWTEDGEVVSTEVAYSFNVSGDRTLVANFSLQQFDIAVSALPEEGGFVTGGGTYTYGQSCTIIAMVNEGYTFANWTENGEVISLEATYTFTVAGDRNLVANFSVPIQNYNINVLSEPSLGGTVTGGGAYTYGQSCTIIATANEGYTFVNWTENGEVISSEATYTFTVTGDRNLVANFVPIITPTLIEGLIAYYPFDGNANDYSGNGNHGTIIGNVIPVTDRQGNPNGAYSFPGEAFNYISVPDAEILHLNNFTLSAWVYSDVENYGSGYLINKGRDIDNGSYRLYVRGVGATTEYGGINDASVEEYPETGKWHMITGTVEGDQARYYLDDVLVEEKTLSHPFSCSGTDPLTFGVHYYTGVPSYWAYTLSGAIDDVRIYDRALAPEEVNILYNYDNGCLAGLFSVNENNKVSFSKGNLQYQASTDTWRFAENQWDFVGGDNSNISSTYDGWIDLFGWGTSGYDHGALGYNPWTISQNNGEYLAYGDSLSNLNDYTGQADWGYNAISNGCNTENSGWRTLTQPEWEYLINGRSTTSGIRYVKAIVHDVQGIILLPDNWDTIYYSFNNPDEPHSSFNSNVINTSQWGIIENYGAVFLPCAGERVGTSVQLVGNSGDYWSATCTDSEGAFFTFFYWDYVGTVYGHLYDRYKGHSVRLVRSAQNVTYGINATPIPAEGGSIEGAGAYEEGSTCTLIATANEDYTFMYWTENGNQVSADATYSFTVTDNRELVAHFALPFAITATASPTQGGSINGIGEYDYGSTCTLTAIANDCYSFMGWTENGNLVSTNAEYSFTVTSDHDLVANYTDKSLLTVYDGTENNGFVPVYGYYCDAYLKCETVYPMGQIGEMNGGVIVGLKYYATQTDVSWGNASFRVFLKEVDGSSISSFTGSEDATIVYEGSLNISGGVMDVVFTTPYQYNGGNLLIGFYNVNKGGYVKSSWFGESVEGASVQGYSYNGLDAINPTQRNFIPKTMFLYYPDGYASTYSINASVDPSNGGSVSGVGTYDRCTNCTLTATPDEGYVFVNWMENGEMVSTESVYSFTVTGNRDLVANFDVPSVGDYVDLGLPSGTLWSTCNLGAQTPESFGEYYAWGETQPKDIYDWSTYQHCMGSGYDLTKYCNESYFGYNDFTDYLSVLLPEDDAAVVNWGTDWLMPTKEDWQELFDNTTNTWTIQKGVKGRLFTASNGNSLFLPTPGYRGGEELYEAGEYGCYWSSTVNTELFSIVAWDLRFYSDTCGIFSDRRSFGFSIRPVHSPVYLVTASVNPEEGGSVVGVGDYVLGSTCTLTATPNEGYVFTNWTENGDVVSSEAAYSFAVTGDRNLVANFVPMLSSISDDFNDGIINPDYWTATGPDIYEEEGLIKIQQNVTDYYVALETLPLSIPLDNKIIVNRQFYLHEALHYWNTGDRYFYGNVNFKFNGSDDNYIGICYYDDDWENRHGTYIRTQINGEISETRICDVVFDTWLTETIVLDMEDNTLTYCRDNGTIFTIDIPGISPDYLTVRFKPDGWWTGHYHNMDYININANVSNRMIVVSANLNEAGVITGAGEYEYGSVCTLTAIPNEGYEFQYWAENGETITTEPSFSFIVMADRSLVAHFVPTRQTFNLSPGWSWLSTYVEQDGIDGLSMLEEGLAEDGVMIKSQYDGFVSYNAGSWMGSLNGITNEKMYLVNTSNPSEVIITGPPAQLDEHSITLSPNWNWIGYPSPYEKDVNEALSNLTATEGDVLKSQSCFAIYNAMYGWYGSLNTMTPGMGFMYQSHNSEDVTLTYSDGMSRSLKRNVEVGNNHWVPTIEAYPQNMNVVAIVELNGEEVRDEYYELAVFSGEECRGSVRLVYVEPLHRHVAFLSVSGEEETELRLALYDKQTGKVYFNATDGLRFVANAVLGDLDSPYVARFGSMGLDKNDAETIAFYPNPVRAGQLFQIEMPVECPGVRVSIVNALGTVVSTTDLYAHPATLRAPAVAGVYLLRMVTNKGVAYCRKLVVKN